MKPIKSRYELKVLNKDFYDPIEIIGSMDPQPGEKAGFIFAPYVPLETVSVKFTIDGWDDLETFEERKQKREKFKKFYDEHF